MSLFQGCNWKNELELCRFQMWNIPQCLSQPIICPHLPYPLHLRLSLQLTSCPLSEQALISSLIFLRKRSCTFESSAVSSYASRLFLSATVYTAHRRSCFNVNILVKLVIVIFLSVQPPAKGAFLRGSGMNQSTGRFTAPITGIYQFSANVHIGKPLRHTLSCALSQCRFKRPKSRQHLMDWLHFYNWPFVYVPKTHAVNHSVLPYKVNV